MNASRNPNDAVRYRHSGVASISTRVVGRNVAVWCRRDRTNTDEEVRTQLGMVNAAEWHKRRGRQVKRRARRSILEDLCIEKPRRFYGSAVV